MSHLDTNKKIEEHKKNSPQKKWHAPVLKKGALEEITKGYGSALATEQTLPTVPTFNAGPS